MYMHIIMKGILEMRKFGLVHVRVIVSVKSKLSRDTFISSISFCASSPILGGSRKCSGEGSENLLHWMRMGQVVKN